MDVRVVAAGLHADRRARGRRQLSGSHAHGERRVECAGEHDELANLASFLISDQAGYINGEMVVQDGGAHLRSSGAEDLLQWTDAQWEKQRAARPCCS